MKKMNRYFLGLAALAFMASCSNDELVPDAGKELPGVASGEAYLTVRLQDANAMTRATGGDYVNGVASEHTIKDAQFFFFDAEGVFVGKASVWNGGNDNGEHESTGNNVEFKGNTVVVLRGVTSKNYPAYLLTVLNAQGFEAEATLPETSKALQTWNKAYDATDHFVMSTSSYFSGNDAHDKFYYATKVESTQFQDEPVKSAEEGAVQIYVERLAAKVQVTTGADLQKAENGLYKVKVSVAGDPNDQGDVNEGITEVYVEFTNWGLSGTTKDSYLSKQLQSAWSTGEPFTGWAASGDYRCFWAESTVYDQAITTEDPTTLDYNTYSGLKSVVNGSYDVDNFGYAYCNENTNTVANITENGEINPAKVTSVLIGARVCDVNKNPLDLVRHNGLLFEKEDYLNYVVNVLNNKTTINVYTEYTETTQHRLDGSFLKLERNSETKELTVVIDDAAFDGKTFYALTETEEGKTATEISAEDAKKALQDSWNAYATDELAKYLFVCDEAFTNGVMYYNIPIEHLAGFGAENAIQLGSYGVVRNHWYQIVLNKIENLGTGVFDEEEVIIPETPEKKYYLDATINILSWKIVNQSVDL